LGITVHLSDLPEGSAATSVPLDELVVGRCAERLQERGMRRTVGSFLPGVLEMRLSLRFTGWVGVTAKALWDAADSPVQVTARVAVRDEDISQLTATLRGLPPEDPGVRARSLVSKDLNSLLPERGSSPQEWVARTEAEADAAARRIADDIAAAGYAYMESAASPDAYFAELTQQVWRLLWPHEGAVAYMLHGDPEEAKRMLLTIARPVAQGPTTWADEDGPSAAFFRSFEAHFGMDLGIGDWPVRAS
jgi:hypothetical protein